MSDLLGIGASGVRAYRTALAVVGENVANAETPGYARRTVGLREIAPAAGSPLLLSRTSGGGVTAASIDRAWNDYTAAGTRDALADASGAETRAKWLGAVETALPDGDSGISAKITGFFAAADKLSADPTSTVARTATLSALDEAAGAIRSGATGLARVSEGIAGEAKATVASANGTLAALATLNVSIARAPAGSATKASLADERDRLVDALAGNVGIDAKVAADGSVEVALAGSGRALVNGDGAATLDLAVASDGRLAFAIGGETIAASAGALAGLADAAAGTAQARAGLDTLAVDFAGQINAWQAQGRTPAGTTGAPLLAVAGTAATLAIAATGGSAIAAASADGVANGNLTALTDLRGTDGPEARMSAIVAANAQALAAATAQSSAAGTRRDAALSQRADGAGVDLDREAAELIRFQQAYDGSARVIQVARETLQAILQLF